jgi:hypothetical protein
VDERHRLDPGLGVAQRVTGRAVGVLAHLQVQEARDDLQRVADPVMDLGEQRVPLLERLLQLRLEAALAMQLRAESRHALLERPEDARDGVALQAAERDQPLGPGTNRSGMGVDFERPSRRQQRKSPGHPRTDARGAFQETDRGRAIAGQQVQRRAPEQLPRWVAKEPPRPVVREPDGTLLVEQQDDFRREVEDRLENAVRARHRRLGCSGARANRRPLVQPLPRGSIRAPRRRAPPRSAAGASLGCR